MQEIGKAENEEILKLLKLIKGFLERHQDGDTPVRFAYVNKYIEKYSSSSKVKITQSVLGNLHDPKNEFTDPKSTVRVYMNNNFKPFLRRFFETEGKNLPYELSIPDGTYNELQLKRRAMKGSISYTERPYLRMKYRPFVFNTIASALMVLVPLMFLSSIIIFFTEITRSNPKAPWLGLLLVAITLFAMPFVVALIRLPDKKFVSFYFKNFLKLSNREVVLASYAANCPICKDERGVVELIFSWKRGKGYLGECKENPDSHIFSFDHTSLTGERL